jgi:hypothetical protein
MVLSLRFHSRETIATGPCPLKPHKKRPLPMKPIDIPLSE